MSCCLHLQSVMGRVVVDKDKTFSARQGTSGRGWIFVPVQGTKTQGPLRLLANKILWEETCVCAMVRALLKKLLIHFSFSP